MQCTITTSWLVECFQFVCQRLTPLQNAGLAIFTLIGSQLLGYGYAGLLQDLLVKPTKCFWPSTSKILSFTM